MRSLLNAPAAFIHPCQPTVAKEPRSGPGWAHELKHDGYTDPRSRWDSRIERKTALKWVLRKAREGIQYVEHAEGHGDKLFAAVCNLGLKGIVSKKLRRRIGRIR